MTGSMDNQTPTTGDVYVVVTQKLHGTIVDVELLDAPPRWPAVDPNGGTYQTLRVGSVNGGDTAELDWPDVPRPCVHCGGPVVWDETEVDWRHVRGPECPLALEAKGYSDDRPCPGLPGNPPCSNAADAGDRYCGGCRAEFGSRPDDEHVVDPVVTDEQDERDASELEMIQVAQDAGLEPPLVIETDVDRAELQDTYQSALTMLDGPKAPRVYSVHVLNDRNQLREYDGLTRREAHELRDERLETHPGWLVRVRVDRDELKAWRDELGLNAADVVALTTDERMERLALADVEARIRNMRENGETWLDEYPRLVGKAARLRQIVRRQTEPPPAEPAHGRYTLVLIDRDVEHAPDGDFAWVREVDVDDVGAGHRLLALGGELYSEIVKLDRQVLAEGGTSA